ncbi:hypothetical protein MLD38_036944 [Melastoma candidum]|uniref:Uncharacterized protein n=1 Tax=Melastoma candidum TaxID=119954 RepID=A0ACB9LKK1_9MYRT|nr:hypothetical protein MLD38_036944 [Melastoma candidum]
MEILLTDENPIQVIVMLSSTVDLVRTLLVSNLLVWFEVGEKGIFGTELILRRALRVDQLWLQSSNKNFGPQISALYVHVTHHCHMSTSVRWEGIPKAMASEGDP